MLESPKLDTLRDFRQRYNGTYGFYVKDDKTKIPVRINEANERAVSFTDKLGMAYTANLDAGVNFEFVPVTKRLFKHDSKLYYCQRVPAHQFRRGICDENTQVVYLQKGKWKVTNFDFDIFGSSQQDVGDLKKEVEAFKATAKVTTLVLSKFFGISDGRVFFFDQAIGIYRRKENKILLDDAMFLQELKDTLARANIQFTVEIGSD